MIKVIRLSSVRELQYHDEIGHLKVNNEQTLVWKVPTFTV